MEGVLSSLQPAVEAVGAALTALVTTRVPLPIVSSLVGAHLPEFEKKELSSAITTAFNIPGDEPSFALFFVVHASFLTLWFAGTRERVDSRTPGRTAFGSWFQSLLGFIMMNMTGNCIAGMPCRVPCRFFD